MSLQFKEPDVAASILGLLQRSGCGLVYLGLTLSTGLSSSMATRLLMSIPTLRHFKVTRQNNIEVGVLTEDFLDTFCEVYLNVETLEIDCVLGYPKDDKALLIQDAPWMGKFLAMLKFQFDRKADKPDAHKKPKPGLRVVDLLPSERFSPHCPFGEEEHQQLDLLMEGRDKCELRLFEPNETYYCRMPSKDYASDSEDGKGWRTEAWRVVRTPADLAGM
ncbi:hypothetical protein C8R43DRAFT_1143820 [Mycena crocata]|nr:hypothetical protein C8R43DRAFT_1143820 [Mycena crocata]